MKKITMLALVSLLLPVGLFAKSTEENYVASYKGRSNDMPLPVEVVSPKVGSQYAGETVNLTFVVDADGKARDLQTTSLVDSQLENAVKLAVSKWQFAPAVRNGAPVATKVVLPVRISEQE